jgi:hypothetical protein
MWDGMAKAPHFGVRRCLMELRQREAREGDETGPEQVRTSARSSCGRPRRQAAARLEPTHAPVVRSRFPERRQSQVSEADAASLLREVFDALNEHDLDRIAAVADKRFEFVDVGGGETVHGREQWRAYCGRFVKAFPDLTQEVTNLVAECYDSMTLLTQPGLVPESAETAG